MILLIDNYDSFSYNLFQQAAAIEPDMRVVRNDALTVSEIEGLNPSHIILSPGPGYPKDAGICEEVVSRLGGSIPILGVCLGHQAIAESFGASLQQLPLPKHGHESPLTIVDPTDILYHGLTYPVQVGRYHSWIVNPHTLPSCLRISALDEEGHIMSFYHTSLPIRGVQYHPESIITRQGRQMINNWINEEKSL